MNCPTSGFPTLRYNKLRDFIASILTEVFADVRVEPPLQPLTVAYLPLVMLRMVPVLMYLPWDSGESPSEGFFDVKVFNANAPCYWGPQVSPLYHASL